ncbi:MAG: serine/threonine protein kinase, partial [Myxococcaceae bacterium]|nr:serine/threonine protein kinase [Myxococcaceae bacterium]
VMDPNAISVPEFEVLNRLPPIGGAEVFLARKLGSAESVLLRVLRQELAASPILVARFLDAVAAARAVSHPHLARVLDAGLTPLGRPWVATEYFEGEDLAQHLKTNTGLSAAELIRLAVPMCQALEAAHAVGVLHGGIKPSSIFLARGLGHEASRLLDLGLSRFEGDLSVEGDRAAQVALLMYAAPETIAGSPPDARSDIYSFGVVLYEALTGVPPFVASGPDELRRLQLEKPARPLTGANLPLAGVVERCLAKNPIDRFSSARQLMDALLACRLPSTLDPEQVPANAQLSGTPVTDEAREQLGDLLGPYQLVRMIGEGSMGRVYLAEHTKLGRQVALKVLRTSQTRHRALVQRFFQEARTVNQINHEHIVEVFDFVEELTADGINLVYCVMELLAGTNLAGTLSREHLTISRCVAMTRQICSALGAAHQVGVVHRDVKPDNIFLTTRGGQQDYVKVLDFGVAKVAVQPGLKTTVSETASGALVGTPTYMAPEQASGLEVDSRADIYAVGTLLYEMLAGHPPFQSTNFGQLAAEIITKDPPPLGTLSLGGERIPPGLKAVLLRALEKDPKARYQTMEELGEALAPFAVSGAASQSPSRRVALVGGAVALVAIAALVVTRAQPAEPPVVAEPVAPIVPPVVPVPVPELPKTIKLTIGSTPPGAHVFRQDTRAELGITPLSVEVPRDDAQVVLSLKLDGHLLAERKVRLDSNTSLEVSLQRERGPIRPVPDKPRKSVGKESTLDPFAE